MPTKKIEVTYDLSDYISKGGFGDGDDGAALDQGYAHRDLAVRILNEELEKAGLTGWKAEAVEVGTIHNPCQLAVVSSSGREIDISGADEDHLELCGYDASDAALVKLREVVWPAAWARFETEAA